MDIRRLWSIHEFYHHLLGIPDIDLQTVSWERVVESLMTLRNANAQTADNLPRFVKDVSGHQSKQRMDAHDIANRLMRRENYFVALFNKEVFDLSLPVPLLGSRQFYSKSLEFCIQFCFNGFIFDDQGRVNPSCLERRDRNQLIQLLRHRFRLTAIISFCVAPFNIGFHCIYYFSRYYAVSDAFCNLPPLSSLTNDAGVSQQPRKDQRSGLYTPSRMELSRVQRAPTQLPTSYENVLLDRR